MEAIKDWALAVCVAAVAGSLAHLAVPAGSTQKVYKITISMFFLCCMLSPILTGLPDGAFSPEFSQPETEYRTEALSSAMEQQIQTSFESSVRQLVQQELGAIGVQAEEIFINVNTDAQGGILITEMAVHLNAQHQSRAAEIETVIAEKIGLKPVLSFRQEVG